MPGFLQMNAPQVDGRGVGYIHPAIRNTPTKQPLEPLRHARAGLARSHHADAVEIREWVALAAGHQRPLIALDMSEHRAHRVGGGERGAKNLAGVREAHGRNKGSSRMRATMDPASWSKVSMR